MKKLILVAIAFFALGAFAANLSLTEASQPEALHLYRSDCGGGYCFGTLVKVADPADPAATPHRHREKMRWTTAAVTAFLNAGVIVDDSARPSFLGANPYPTTDAGPLSP